MRLFVRGDLDGFFGLALDNLVQLLLIDALCPFVLGFTSGGFLFRTFPHPGVGLSTFGVVLLVYFGQVRFKGVLPGGLVAVALGTALAWATGLVQGGWPTEPPHFYPPQAAVADLFA